MYNVIITHSFVAAVTPGWYKYVFYVLYGDYLDYGREYTNEFRQHLERLARNLGDEGAVIEPFRGDIDRTRDEIWDKEWDRREREQLQNLPSLLVLTKSLSEFSPRSDPWLLLHFKE